MVETVSQLVKDIKDNLTQKSASQKDEVLVMKAMVNDSSFKVGEYSKAGLVGEYCPYEDSRKLVASIINSAAHIPTSEAKSLADSYEFTKSDAAVLVNISKEFVNTYVQTGRKLPLGGRESSSVSLELKTVAEAKKQFPIVGSTERGESIIPAHTALKASGPCPVWLKK